MKRILIKGTGVVSALGDGRAETMSALADGGTHLSPLTRFPSPHLPPLPVGEISGLSAEASLPETHMIACRAADQAMAGCSEPPDAVVLGTTTGGLPLTERLLKANCADPNAYRRHGVGTVTDFIGRRFGCRGPAITVSTACSSGACAIALAVAMLRSGSFTRILAGGADALCRLTYHGFKALQLIDPDGARPLDENRRGMSVAEGAGMLLLEVARDGEEGIEILGAGLSCDAHHPAQPHPEGRGAASAITAALKDAGLPPEAIDYINLHGTGTLDNDRSEALAVKTVFGTSVPPLSSVKGAMGHPLAAAGAIEAGLSALAIEAGLLPENTGCEVPDPALGLSPILRPTPATATTVLSNSFGFGGNNAALIVGRSRKQARLPGPDMSMTFSIIGWAAVTGAGHTKATVEKIANNQPCRGMIGGDILCESLPRRDIRRLKRLSQMALALSAGARQQAGGIPPGAVFLGTAWGSLSETHDFLGALFESEERFASPTDFIGSVHNAPAGQIALGAGAQGPNLTLSGGDHSFEQALFAAEYLAGPETPVLVAGVDEGHEKLSPLFDPSVSIDGDLSDGGGALMIRRTADDAGPRLRLLLFAPDVEGGPGPEALAAMLGEAGDINERYDLILAGIPAARRDAGEKRLARFLAHTNFSGRVVDFRRLTGEFATATAVAAATAADLVASGATRGALILGFGEALSAMEVTLS